MTPSKRLEQLAEEYASGANQSWSLAVAYKAGYQQAMKDVEQLLSEAAKAIEDADGNAMWDWMLKYKKLKGGA